MQWATSPLWILTLRALKRAAVFHRKAGFVPGFFIASFYFFYSLICSERNLDFACRTIRDRGGKLHFNAGIELMRAENAGNRTLRIVRDDTPAVFDEVI